MIKTIQEFADEIYHKNNAAIEAADMILEINDDNYSELKSDLHFNKYLIKDIESFLRYSPERMEALIMFAYKEFIKIHPSRYEFFGNKKKDKLLNNGVLKNIDFKNIYDEKIEPLIDVFDSYDDTRKIIKKKLKDTVLIVTALPLEFRSVVRRLHFISDVKTVEYKSTRILKLHDQVDAFEHVFDKKKDNFIHLGAADNDSHDRPFFVFVEGVFKQNDLYKKVHIVLPPNYGHIITGKTMLKCENYNNVGINYSEVIIAGIAGGIDRENKLMLGDLVVSNNIFGSETKKASQIQSLVSKSKYEKDIEFRSTHMYPYDIFDYDLESWKPTLFVKPPIDTENPDETGFKQALSADYVSIDTLSKATWFKEKLWDTFPSCTAIEMEAFGVSSYIMEKKKSQEVRIIKSICDYGDYRKNKIWQDYCADVASSFVEDYLIKKYGKSII